MNGLTTTEAAKRLSIPQTTLKTWLSNLPIPTQTDSRGKRRLDEEALRVLETIKELRSSDCGYETIRRHIGPASVSQPSADEPSLTTDELPSVSVVVSEVIAAIRAENDLAEKYAKATYTIGQLEERVSSLSQQLDEAKSRIALLEAPQAKRPWWRPW